MNLKMKETLAKILTALLKISRTLIVNQSYTSSTVWAKRVNFTAPTSGVYRIRTPYSNAPVLGMAVGLSSATSIAATIVFENSTGASIDQIFWLDAGTYSVWTKCGGTGTNWVMCWRLIDMA